MASSGDRVSDPISGATIVFAHTAAETEGALLRLEMSAAPRWTAGPTHVHPRQEERVQVDAGVLTARVGGATSTHSAGDVVAVPPGIPHTLWNGGGDEVRLVVEFRPALRMEHLLETVFGVARTRKTRTSLRELFRIAVATRGFRDEFRLARPHLVDKRRATKALARYTVNPLLKAAFALGVAPRGYALLETTGRKSGRPRRTPVGYRREGDVVWLVAEHGARAGWVRNVRANGRVRLKLGRRWHSGAARPMPDDEARARLADVGTPLSRLTVRAMKTDLLTVRVDLDGA